MKENYEELLKKAYSELPHTEKSKERFEIPKAKGHVEGNKTIISNFNQICITLRRESKQLLKYLQRELATPASIDGPRLILGRKLPSHLVNQKITQYAEDFVLCKECKKPDTKLTKEGSTYILKCMACGARHPIKAKI